MTQINLNMKPGMTQHGIYYLKNTIFYIKYNKKGVFKYLLHKLKSFVSHG